MTPRPVEAERLRIYMTETARHEGQPLFEWLIAAALRHGLAGATAIRGLAGFGHHRRVHHSHLLDISDALPVIVEIIDAPAKIGPFLDLMDEALAGHTYTRDRILLHQPEVQS
jgi:uncharacterized protein